MTGSTPEIRAYRWVICAMAFLVLFVSNGMLFGGMSVFDIQLMATLSEAAGREILVSEIKARDSIMLVTAAFCGIASGWMVDKVGVKPLILVGLAMLAMGNLLYARIDTLVQIYWIQAGFGVVLALCGLMLNVYLVSSWFDKQRGLAIGLILAGTSLGNAFFPKLNTMLIGMGGWRQAFEWLAWVPLILIPVAFLLIKNGPLGAGKQTESAAAAPVQLGGYSLGEALSSRNFWIVAIVAMCTFYSILGMSTNIFIYLSKADYSPQAAASGVSILFTGGLAGKLIAGYLAESLGHKRILLTSLGLMLAGAACLLAAIQLTSATALWAGLICFGFGWGGIYTLIQLLAADLFGMRALGKILAAINVLDAVGGGAGPFFTGLLYDRTGSYFAPFAVITGLLCVALISASLLDMSHAAINMKKPQHA